MNIIFSDERMPGQTVVDLMIKAAVLCSKQEGVDPERVSVSVTFVSSEEIRELNRIYRNKDAVTDVLSFPQFETPSDTPEEGEVCLGDVVICSEQALIQADEYGHSGERELVYLFVHSVFHLLGYDHMTEEDKSDMRTREESIMEQIGLTR
ncbi:rRNA maturation RNase YbeY [Bacilliculturomica massiliensis]|uniref:rRNA maturation RNase YbeY n=1 Tax=Bacilliculturomica massiliensis TaxID=1917867 RepID=UPI001031F597|nr:rRNA maturation RNase YbeY [Bacilliculturomica massiliensis]